jgi:hypothetical protein
VLQYACSIFKPAPRDGTAYGMSRSHPASPKCSTVQYACYARVGPTSRLGVGAPRHCTERSSCDALGTTRMELRVAGETEGRGRSEGRKFISPVVLVTPSEKKGGRTPGSRQWTSRTPDEGTLEDSPTPHWPPTSPPHLHLPALSSIHHRPRSCVVRPPEPHPPPSSRDETGREWWEARARRPIPSSRLPHWSIFGLARRPHPSLGLLARRRPSGG